MRATPLGAGDSAHLMASMAAALPSPSLAPSWRPHGDHTRAADGSQTAFTPSANPSETAPDAASNASPERGSRAVSPDKRRKLRPGSGPGSHSGSVSGSAARSPSETHLSDDTAAAAPLEAALAAAVALCVDSRDMPAAAYGPPRVQVPPPRQRKQLPDSVRLSSPAPLAVAAVARRAASAADPSSGSQFSTEAVAQLLLNALHRGG